MSVYVRFGKRLLDVLAGALGAVLTGPLHALCAVFVAATSGRPVYFAQERAGRDGKTFRLFKLRTMRADTHRRTGGYPTDSDVTRVGRLLRKTSLDELPQLLNIIRGDMSLVGPRPALLDQVERYNAIQRGRLSVRPGLTGLAQVRHRNVAPWSVRILSDLEYVESISLKGDLKIMLKTIPAVLRGSSVKLGQTAADVDDLAPKRIEAPGP